MAQVDWRLSYKSLTNFFVIPGEGKCWLASDVRHRSIRRYYSICRGMALFDAQRPQHGTSAFLIWQLVDAIDTLDNTVRPALRQNQLSGVGALVPAVQDVEFQVIDGRRGAQ